MKTLKINIKLVTAAALFVPLLISLFLINAAIQNSAEFNKYFFPLLIINLTGLFLLLVLIGASMIRLILQFYHQTAGARLTLRLMLIFATTAIAPLAIVYYFSLDLLSQGVDRWFDVKVENALNDSLELSRIALNSRIREYRHQSEGIAVSLSTLSSKNLKLHLNELRKKNGIYELSLITATGEIAAFSSADKLRQKPETPTESILQSARQSGFYVEMDSIDVQGLHLQVILYLPAISSIKSEYSFLQALFPVNDRAHTLADNVQTALSAYKELAFMRQQLKSSFILILTLVLLLSVLGALWAAIYFSQRLVQPIKELAHATRDVAAGHYDKQLPPSSNDEIGFLVNSFNDMTRRIAATRDEAKLSQTEVEQQRAYLEAVLGRLSTGVITLDHDLSIHTANHASSQILGLNLTALVGKQLSEIEKNATYTQAFINVIVEHIQQQNSEWTEQVAIFGNNGRQILICRGSVMPADKNQRMGYIIVYDDITTLVQAQRNAAWGEVARRLAHEIKNPLTPIQLSAERLRHKYLGTMSAEDAQVLDRATHTIVQQVEAMKEMVKAFSEYALVPQLKLIPLNINQLIREVVDLYENNQSNVEIRTDLAPELPLVEADANRMRQLLHNLIKNAMEAMVELTQGKISITTRIVTNFQTHTAENVEILIQDTGPGFPANILENLFDPYVTTKPKGSGLGLAIVKKIVEEHNGIVWAENSPPKGASMIVRLPLRNGNNTLTQTKGNI